MSGRFAPFVHVARLGYLLFLRDFRVRYRQTFGGPLWAVGQALLSGLPMILVGSQLDLGGGQGPRQYALFALSGLLLWQMFWDGLYSPQWLARRLRGIVAEVPFPLEALVIAGCWYALFNATLYSALLLVAFAMLGVTPPATFLAGLACAPVLIAAGAAVGILFVPLTFIYLDFRYGLPMLAPAILWTAPILYVTPASGPLRIVNELNPLTYLVAVPRQLLVEGPVNAAPFGVAAVVFFAILIVALRFYRHAMPTALECLPNR